jgi:voltage-gated potassium channel
MRKLVGSIRRTYRDVDVRNVGLMLAALIAGATAFYVWVEGWSVIDALYFAVATITTTGAGDLVPRTAAGKAFTIAFIVLGIALFLALIQFMADDFLRGRRASARPEDPD